MGLLADHNWNIFASSILIEVCRRFGSQTFFVSPGYRDAPFIAALQLREGLEVVSCWDERAAAFQALGWAKHTGKPAVLLCTSGTAGANYLPAVIEAKIDHTPLVVITADRPFELVFANAQQVIDQRNLFGQFVKKSLNFPSPSPTLNVRAWASYMRLLLTTALEDRPGPVHMNLPFAAPLDPLEVKDKPSAEVVAQAERWLEAIRPDEVPALRPAWTPAIGEALLEDVRKAERGLLLIGRLQSAAERSAVRTLRDRLGWPVFADVGSGVKFESELEVPDINIPSVRALLDRYAPDCVVHLGKRLVTRHYDDALARWNAPAYWVLSDEENVQDPYHLPQRRQVRPDFAGLLERLPKAAKPHDLLPALKALRRGLDRVASPSFNFRDVAAVVAGQTRRNLFLGNSTAIRAFDSWRFATGEKGLEAVANRGVSGIEGLLATTMGLSLASRETWTLLVGDIAMLHDLNSLISLAQSQAQVLVVIVNNVGGRIFETLPVQAYPWVKDPLISTPHDFDFAGIAAMARLPYHLCESREGFARVYESLLPAGRSAVIECRQAADADYLYAKALSAQEIPYE